MDNRLYQQLSTGWTYRWQQIIEYMTAPKSMLELSMVILFLVLMSKMLSWCPCSKCKRDWSGLIKTQILVIAALFILSDYVQYKVPNLIKTYSLYQTYLVVFSFSFSFIFLWYIYVRIKSKNSWSGYLSGTYYLLQKDHNYRRGFCTPWPSWKAVKCYSSHLISPF